MYTDIHRVFTFFPFAEWMRWPIVLSAIAFEMTIPVLLLFSRTRLIGIGAGLFFHLMLALHPHPGVFGFTTFCYAHFVLFLPAEAIRDAKQRMETRVRHWLSGSGEKRVIVRLAPGGVLLALVMFVLAPLGDVGEQGLAVGTAIARRVLYVWALMSIVGFTVLVGAPRNLKRYRTRVLDFKLSPSALVIPLMVFVGFTPYLGLNTRVNFSMFSNLRTENGMSNHFFLRDTGWLGDYQRDLVEIIDSSAEDLLVFRAENFRITYFELRRSLSWRTDPDFFVEYKRAGRIERVDASTKGPSIPPRIQRTVMIFRPVAADDALCPCLW
jgi:hypothetical protein